jgi:tetratricopeptide (TPR) repeat protein
LRDSALTYYLLGESYSDLARFDEAAAAYRSAVSIEQRFPAAWFALAKAYRRLGRDTQAREAEAQLEKLDPKLAQRLRDGS